MTGHSQFRAMMWKNWRIKVRNPWCTAGEILIPVTVCIFITFLPIQYARRQGRPPFPTPPPRKMDFRTTLSHVPKRLTILWTTADGTNNFINNFREIIENSLGETYHLILLPSSESLLETLNNSTNHTTGENIICGIIIDGRNSELQLCHPQLKIIIRFPGDQRSFETFPFYGKWMTDKIDPENQTEVLKALESSTAYIPTHSTESYMYIQETLTEAIEFFCTRGKISVRSTNTSLDKTAAMDNLDSSYLDLFEGRAPARYESHEQNFQFLLPFLIMLAFYYSSLAITNMLITEKDAQLKELMKIMKLPSSVYWVSWFITTMITLIISCLIIAILFKIPLLSDKAIFGNADMTLVFIFFVCYMIALTCFCFMMSAFFSKAHIGYTFTVIMWFVFYAPHFFTVNVRIITRRKLILATFLNVAMAYGVEVFISGERNKKGIKWSNVCVASRSTGKVTVCHCMMMLLLDAAIYLLICVYVDSVHHGTYGLPKPICFFFKAWNWLTFKHIKEEAYSPKPKKANTYKSEKEPYIPAGIQARNLKKTFKKKETVLEDFSLNSYDGQITVLLGHCGAGKTTAISMLTGMYSATSGHVIINGYDLAKYPKYARRSLALCPENHVLFKDLTVHEHLYFFCKLKGVDKGEEGDNIQNEIMRFIEMLQLVPQEHCRSKILSQGMKRRLNIGIALCGNSRVVLLDEPTFDVDLVARRTIWEMLQLEKEGRTVLLSTQFMDEANVLGDRVAVMADGQLQSSGSPSFLKKKSGGDYRLMVQKGRNCDSDEVTEILNYHIVGITPSQDVGSQLCYQIAEKYAKQFPKILQDLQDSKHRLDAQNFGVAFTAMEEVFLTSGKEKGTRSSVIRNVEKYMIPGTTGFKVEIPEMEDLKENLLWGRDRECQRISALMRKKFLVHRRALVIAILHILLPLIFIVLTLLVPKQEVNLSPTEMQTIGDVFGDTRKIAPIYALAMAFIAAYFIHFIIRERTCRNKHLQLMSGVEPSLFWFVHLTSDAIFFLIPYVITCISILIFPGREYDPIAVFGIIFIVLVFYGWAMLPFMYCSSFLFDVPISGCIYMATFNLVIGVAAFLVISFFQLYEISNGIVTILNWLFHFSPHYCLARAVQNILINNIYIQKCEPYVKICRQLAYHPCCPDRCSQGKCFQFSRNYFGFRSPGVGGYLIAFLILGVLFLVILLMIEYRVFSNCCRKCRKKSEVKKDEYDEMIDDPDVRAEETKIQDNDIEDLHQEYILVLQNITKSYGKSRIIDNISFGVKKGQCFGLLGCNGAGKSTTFDIVTGFTEMSEGEVYIGGLSLRKNREEVLPEMGYCPQSDGLLLEMTGWETLKMFCLLRGIPKARVDVLSQKLANLLLITDHMQKRCAIFSEGNKRKLNVAIAFIGTPALIILDEPTSGMDPVARRHLWKVICNVRDSGSTIMLTSHSMEECEALCNDIAIQVDGRLTSLGSLQDLKHSSPQGYCVQVKVTPPSSLSSVPPTTRKDSSALMAISLDPVKNYILFNFPDAVLDNENMGCLTYSIPKKNIPWSQMFVIMEKAKKQYDIEDYSIRETSLEQVFLSNTK